MFTIFVNIALYFNLTIKRKFFTLSNLIFILTIITTFSTTGYIALSFTVLLYLLFYSKSKFKIVYLSCFIIGSVYVSNLDFLKVKILQQIKESDKTKGFGKSSGASRFGSVYIHYQVISEYPITGVGDGATRYIADFTDADSTANGVTFVFVKYGLFIGIFYYFLLLKSCKNIMKYYTKGNFFGYDLFILLLILAFSQDITVRLFYFFLIIWGMFIMAPKTSLKKHSVQAIKYM
ncbi:MAG TPA: O-antigen ligase family protein [Mucilaginibacter sp.]